MSETYEVPTEIALTYEPYAEVKRWKDLAGNPFSAAGDVVVTCAEHGEVIRFMSGSYLEEEHPYVNRNAVLWRENHLRDDHSPAAGEISTD